MTVTCTGAQLKAFWNCPLPEGQWFEDETIIVDGAAFDTVDGAINEIPDGAVVKLDGGYVAGDPKERSVEKLLRDWIKGQTTMQFVIEFDKGREAEIRIVLKNAKVKVIA